MKRDHLIHELRQLERGGVLRTDAKPIRKVAEAALAHIFGLEERVAQLSSPARSVIRMAEADGVDVHALMNAHLQKMERQSRELSKLNDKLAELQTENEKLKRKS